MQRKNANVLFRSFEKKCRLIRVLLISFNRFLPHVGYPLDCDRHYQIITERFILLV